MTTTIILPISRPDHLSVNCNRLELLQFDKERTNLIVMIDGDAELYLSARNYGDSSKFAQRLRIQRKPNGRPRYTTLHLPVMNNRNHDRREMISSAGC